MEMPSEKVQKKVVYLTFPPESPGKPLVCDLALVYQLRFSILKAQITPRHEGQMTIEISGDPEAFDKGLTYLKEHGVGVVPAAQRISRDEALCIHCGVCTALCPTKSLALDLDSRLVTFDAESCSSCGMCTKVCPVKAMEILLENGSM
jgi:L-aspartate semialdehyde sulfurtransferase ferredoxin